MEPKILIEHDTDECGALRVLVSGPDYESVLVAALDAKNRAPIEHGTEIDGPKVDLGSGCWRAVVFTRTEQT